MGKFINLPKEIVLEILIRLPTESVLACKLVCKLWRDAVHHSSFSQLHLNNLNSADDGSGKLTFIFVSHGKRGPDEFYYTEFDENSHEIPFNRKTRMDLNLPFKIVSIAGSYNGLLYFNTWWEDNYGPACICNPITREYIMLPRSERNYWWTGFGYVLSTNEYKVVRIYNESGGDSNVRIAQVFTLGSGIGWRNAGTVDISTVYLTKCSGKFANGALHWVDHVGTILSFHLADEKFSKLPSPPCVPQPPVPVSITLGVLGGFLRVSYFSYPSCNEIWLLKKIKDNCNDLSWSKEFSFDRYVSPPFGYTKSGSLLYCEHSKICICDPEASSAERDVSFGKFIFQAMCHRNTLVSLKVLGEEDTKPMESKQCQARRQKKVTRRRC